MDNYAPVLITVYDRFNHLKSAVESLKKCAEAINTEIFIASDVPRKEVKEFVESLSNEQFNQIVDVMAKAPTLSYEINFDCKKCGESNSIEINGLADFFQ